MKKPKIREAFSDALILADSYTRFALFEELSPFMNDAEYWESLAMAHTGSDNGYVFRERKKRAFLSPRKHRELLMDPVQRNFLKNLPDKVTVYRGMTRQEYESGEFGISWTLDRVQAWFFAFIYIRNQDTHHLPKVVVQATARKECIIACFAGESELIVIPQKEGDLTNLVVLEEREGR